MPPRRWIIEKNPELIAEIEKASKYSEETQFLQYRCSESMNMARGILQVRS